MYKHKVYLYTRGLPRGTNQFFPFLPDMKLSHFLSLSLSFLFPSFLLFFPYSFFPFYPSFLPLSPSFSLSIPGWPHFIVILSFICKILMKFISGACTVLLCVWGDVHNLTDANITVMHVLKNAH